ncbi:hypothetical protein HMPREF2912_08665 [Corynebacterium sp. HMSC056E09]|nr:hypothetical protein HMPREF2760_11995 [Corynebacterium sp. HMSC065D07]OFP71695.1 hypothetical protein HMPREF2974_10705 [Corynebacterium sp. HMSC078C09]OFP87093.1 hypothetical protein HMPREF2967_10850 [Corynebacterium sp. HMSC059E07]OFQ95068.1 hypothetical protein HMPREF2912_08665 [Corynebacterium sp. HMSC056E09]
MFERLALRQWCQLVVADKVPHPLWIAARMIPQRPADCLADKELVAVRRMLRIIGQSRGQRARIDRTACRRGVDFTPKKANWCFI